MKLKIAFLLIFWAFLKPLVAQSLTDLRLVWSDFAQTSGHASLQNKQTERFLVQITRHEKRILSKSITARAEYLFNLTKNNFLTAYHEEADFMGMMQKAQFNCLTGTALLASLFSHFNIPYQVIETNHHIFILIDAPEKILVEVTDPNGFIRNAREIEIRLNRYQQQTQLISAENGNHVEYRYSFNLWEKVSLQDLKGRLLYNEAVKSFNKKNLQLSINFLAQAGACSYSERYKEFAQVLSLSVKLNEKIEAEKKTQLLLQLKNISRTNSAFALSAN